ncbi:MAG: hypothetical protein NC420_14995 [Eubacterium sp.]|nr:hypothetical protein [Eubacterium sp.]MCM1411624.1 hypothetical protein [Lachnospiraceae bacterium]
MKKIFKNPFLSTLLVGILATALWEKFISPFCTYIYIHISSLFETFMTSFSNDTYRSIANGFNDSNSVYVILIILSSYLGLVTSFIIFPMFFKHQTNLTHKAENQTSKTKKFFSSKIIVILLFSIFVFCYIYIIGNIIFVTNCKTNSLCNLEIISPYISDEEYKQLKSTFYCIETKVDYINFTTIINEIGEKYSLNLKK